MIRATRIVLALTAFVASAFVLVACGQSGSGGGAAGGTNAGGSASIAGTSNSGGTTAAGETSASGAPAAAGEVGSGGSPGGAAGAASAGVGGTSNTAGAGGALAGAGGELSVFENWPTGASPQEIGKRVAENFVNRTLNFQNMTVTHYAEVCSWYGALTLARLTADQDLDTRLIRKFDPLLAPSGAAYIGARAHVDDRVFGIAPLEMYIQTTDSRYLTLGQGLADAQWTSTNTEGITSEARYWVDDMYMITSLQVQAFRATNDLKYIDRAAKTLVTYLDRLQQPSGLFFHTAASPVYWGRGNGWVAAGLSELLRSLSPTHPSRARILDGYQKMMAALRQYQRDDGLWRQVIDNTTAWPETSGSAMFTFGMISGVKNGWLDAAVYGPAARKAWLGLITYLDSNANLREVCVGTGEANSVVGSNPAAQLQYYLDRPRSAGDFHGQAPVLWSASALLR